MPRVSVIVPNFNHKKYLPERLESITAQTYQDFEIILLDDCSTDGSKEIIEAWRKHPKIGKVILNEKNSGSAFKQWQKGISEASGELIWIAESDDSCSPALLETLVGEFDREPSCVLAFCAAMLTDENGKHLDIHKYHKEIGRNLSVDGEKFARKWLLRNNYVVNASGALFRKDAAMGLGDTHIKYKGVGDWLFWTQLARKGKVSFVYKALNLFRQHGSNTTAGMKKSGEALLELRSLLGDFERLGLKDHRVFLHDRIYAVNFVKYYGSGLSPELRAKILKVWRDNPIISFLAALKEAKHRISILLRK
jgi:glycosyltransferase involved in cell wall biosynthesis